jgi:hypothetical protein
VAVIIASSATEIFMASSAERTVPSDDGNEKGAGVATGALI